MDCPAVRVADAPLAAWAREMLASYIDDNGGDPDWGQQNTLAKRAVVHACGRFSVSEDAAASSQHAHDAGELEVARCVAAELGGVLTDVDVGHGDESDHALAPFYAAAASVPAEPHGEPAAMAVSSVTEALLREHVFGGALDARYPLRVTPFPRPGGCVSGGDAAVEPAAMEAAWLDFRNRVLGIDERYVESEPHWRDGAKGAQELLKWRRAYELFVTHPHLRPGSAVHVAQHEPRHAPASPPLSPHASPAEARAHHQARAAARPMGCIFLQAYLALTHGGSVVGVAAVVVHT